MKRVELIHRGHVTAAGFIIDVPAIGQREARRRTLEMLDPADRLLLMPDERWLMLTENPAEVDSDRAPGAVLVRDGELLAAAPVPGGGAGFTEYRFGVLASLTIGELPAVDHSGWFDLGAVIALQPLEAPHAPDPVVIDPPKAPDLREGRSWRDASGYQRRRTRASDPRPRCRGPFQPARAIGSRGCRRQGPTSIRAQAPRFGFRRTRASSPSHCHRTTGHEKSGSRIRQPQARAVHRGAHSSVPIR